ncbi:MAG: glycosyltransferase family 2 protein [Thermoleophilia bacterium]|nr:glycosyltransferase family 2 protein [Thermoleophilia bacterium]
MTRILAILTVRNEGAFLLDWFAHHRAAGVTDFLVFSNDCADGTDAMLDRLARLGWLSHVRNDGPHRRSAQWDALARAEAHPLRTAADWIVTLDIDEYVNIHAGDGTVPALLGALPGATAITMAWRLFGNAGVVAFEDRPVTEVFTRAAPPIIGWPWRASLFKTLFRNDGTYARLGVHRPRRPDPARIAAARWHDGSGRPLPDAFRTARIFAPLGQDNFGLVQLNHYALGAMESYIVKVDRGRANRDGSAFDMSYWVERNLCSDEDRSIARMRPLSDPIRATLAADPVLGPLHRHAVAWRRARFEALMLEEPFRSLFARLLMVPPSHPVGPEGTRRLTAFALRATGLRSVPGAAGDGASEDPPDSPQPG